MTNKQYNNLTDNGKRIFIAELCGDKRWEEVDKMLQELPEEKATLGLFAELLQKQKEFLATTPNYLTDLNACYEFEEKLQSNSLKMTYYIYLHRIVNNDHGVWDLPTTDKQFNNAHATPRQRCKAFALTMSNREEIK